MATPRFYTLQILNFPKMKHDFIGRRAVLEGDVQPLGRQEFYPNVLKSALLDRQLIHVSKFVLTR